MKIYGSNNRLILDVEVDDNSYRNRVIMGDHNLTLYFSLSEHVEIPVGAYCDYQNERFTLERPEALKMKHSRYFEYTVKMESNEAKAKIFMFRNPVDGRLRFSLTATPREHLQMFVDNMNRRDSGWSVGKCVDGTEVLITYDHVKCYAALGLMAQELKTEFEFNGKQVSLRKVEYNKSNPLPLSYGRGKGFKPNVGRSNSSEEPPVEVLFVQGGERNIDRSKYGAGELLLPKLQTIAYDGEHFEDEEGFNEESARRYVVDDLGLSIRRIDATPSTYAEDSLDCSDIYPKRVGKVTSVVTVNKDKNFYDIIDNTIPSELDYSVYQIEGETMTIIFQSGMLAGREFDVRYYHETRRFEIVPADIDGMVMPNETFKPNVEDTYAVFNCSLPDAYIRDDDTKSGASWDMFRTAVKYMFDNEEQKFTFKGELDGIWAKKDWLNIGGRIILGGYVKFSDDNFQREGVLVRITGIKDYINNPHSPVIELSNETVSSGFSSEMKRLESTEVVIEENHKDAINYTKRRWRDAKETMSMLEEALLENFTDSISPLTIQTMQMLVGDESLQFRFVNNTSNPAQVPHNVNYDQEKKILTSPAGIIQHMTLGISSVSSEHKPNEYKYWALPEYNSPVLLDGEQKYYLYAKVSKTYQTGEFILSERAIEMNGVNDFYHLLMGILNSEHDGERSFVTLYGFTEVLPGRITTDRIVSGDGQSYFDMLNNAMKLSNMFDFNSKGDGQLRLRGTIVQSTGGEDESLLGCYRGRWQSDVVYYNGDEVWEEVDGTISTYRYIFSEPTRGHAPYETLYWQVMAAGKNGSDGKNAPRLVSVFCTLPDGNTPEKPLEGAYPPAGWSINPPTRSVGYTIWMTQCTIAGDGTFGEWSAPVRISGDKGDVGADGTDIEFIYKRSNRLPTDGDRPRSNPDVDDYIPATERSLRKLNANSLRFTGGGRMRLNNLKTESDWTDNPQGVSTTYKYEWMCMRIKPVGSDRWGEFTEPVVWSAYGDQGIDGDGLEYVFRLNDTESAPPISEAEWTDKDGTLHRPTDDDFVPEGWTDDPTGVSAEMRYEYVATRRYRNGAWGAFSTPALWARYSEDGTSVRIRGTVLGYYDTVEELSAVIGTLNTGLYLINQHNGSFNHIANVTDAGSYIITAAEEGDGYIMESTGNLWVATENGWKDVGQIRGDDGKPGEQGNYTEYRYQVNGSTTQAPTLNRTALSPSGWVTAMPTVGKLQYLWLTTALKSGDGTRLLSQWTVPIRVTAYDGKDGVDGSDGTDGRGITGVTEFYAVNNNKAQAPTSWQTTIPEMSPTNKYLWNKERVYYSSGASYEDTDPIIIGVYGDDGRGIKSVTEMYLATSMSSGVTKKTNGWTNTVQSVSKEKPYLYNYEIITYTDGEVAETEISLIGHWGSDGNGIDVKGTVDDWRPNTSGYVKADAELWAVDSPFCLYQWHEDKEQYVQTIPAKGDCYIVGEHSSKAGHMIISDGTKWTDGGLIVGEDGDEFEFVYQRTRIETEPVLVEGAGRDNDDYVPDGWTDDPSGVSDEYPYEWFSMRKKSDKVWGAFSKPALWATYSAQSNPNLLEQTEFESKDNLDKWQCSKYSGGSFTDEVTNHIRSNGKDGFNSYFDSTNRTIGEINYKDVLQQVVYNTDGSIRKLSASTWYTLSWWMRSGQDGMTINETSNSYGFARKEVYLEKGSQYKFSARGYINTAALLKNHHMAVWIYKPDWSWSKSIEIGNTFATTVTLTITDVPENGVYYIMSYMGTYNEHNSGSIASNEMATIVSYMLQKTNQSALYTYCYPSAIDTNEKQYADGQECSSRPSDGNHQWALSPTGDTWVKHTFTFKTKAAITLAEQRILFRLQPSVTNEASAWVEICQPKLEEGMVATAYQPNNKDLHGNGYEFRYAKNKSATIAPSIVVTNPEPAGWSVQQPVAGSGEYIWFTCAKKRTDGTMIGVWSTPLRLTPQDGANGASPAPVYRGVFSTEKTYYGNSHRVDIVKYGSAWYVARVDAPNGTGGFRGYYPTNTNYWNPFGASFESVATELLLAEYANIGNLIFKDGKLISQAGTLNGKESTDYENDDFQPNIVIDGVTGNITFTGKVKSPFTMYANDNFDPVNITSSNVLVYTPQGAAGTSLFISLSEKSSGLRMCFSNFKYISGSSVRESTGPFVLHFKKPGGDIFSNPLPVWENGEKENLIINKGEMVEFIVYGTTTVVFGVIVISRTKLI